MAINGSDVDLTSSNGTEVVIDCSGAVPYSTDLFKHQMKAGLIVVSCAWVCVAFILIVFALEVVFIINNFQTSYRKRNTICTLGLAPVYAVCAIIGVMIPRAGLLVDLVANSHKGRFHGYQITKDCDMAMLGIRICKVNIGGDISAWLFTASCGSCATPQIFRLGYLLPHVVVQFCRYFGLAIYCLMCLLADYLGRDKLVKVQDVKEVRLNTFPLCCCCPCLPKPKFNMRTYIAILVMVYQVTLIRPAIAFLSAILWADGQYTPGLIRGDNAFIYLIVINLASTTVAIWGLVIVHTAFKEPLVKYFMGLKFLFLQLTLLGTTLGNIVIASLVSNGVIPCAEFIPSAARAARIDNAYVVFWMVLVSLCGLLAFRRISDGIMDTSQEYRKRKSIA